jgi:wyosine [tRNA(Phe)-imidazoG37] synthetase (radical SAM superfamily)
VTAQKQGTYYQIVVQGHLAQNWSEWFNGMAIMNLPSGETVLSGLIVDQSALHGTLIKVRDLGLSLISLNRLESNQVKNEAAESGSEKGR